MDDMYFMEACINGFCSIILYLVEQSIALELGSQNQSQRNKESAEGNYMYQR